MDITRRDKLIKNKEEGTDQESMLSSTTPYPRHNMGK